MEKEKMWAPPEENKDAAPPGEDVRKSWRGQDKCSHENLKPESSAHNVKELNVEPLMRVLREVESELPAAKPHHHEPRGGQNKAGGRSEETGTGGHVHTERNRDRHNQDEEEGRLVTSETVGICGNVGVTNKVVRDPSVCNSSQDIGCEERSLQRDSMTDIAGGNLQRDSRTDTAEGNLQRDSRTDTAEGNLQRDSRTDTAEGNLQRDSRTDTAEGNLQRDSRTDTAEGNLQRDSRTDTAGGNLQRDSRTGFDEGNLQRVSRTDIAGGNLQRDSRTDFDEGNLQRDLGTRQFDYSELKEDMGDIENEDLAGEGGKEPTEEVVGPCQPKEYKAGTSCEKSPDTPCLAASCSIADYPYVDFSTNEFIVMCDFAAAEDTQLSVSQGDKVLLLNAVTAEWWWVEHNGHCGYVPASHLRAVHDDDEEEEEDSDIDDPWQDEEYYGSYKTLKLHLEMLSDQPRTETYRNVIIQNSQALKGKRILDLGCGTGIISFFCAQLAEPEIVYAVEASGIAEQTRKLVDENGYSSIVQVQCHRAEELQLPTKVDVLVSEWMGTCLLFEFMSESVLLARDLWLEEDGVMWPSTARVHLVPCSANREYEARVLFWDSPYGLDFSVLKPMAIQEFFSRPKPDHVLKPEDCLSQPCTLLDVNMKTLNVEDLEKMSSDFHFHVNRDGTFHGFTAWFSVQFQNIDNQEQVELDTGPFNQLTHWKHTLFMLDQPMQVYSGDRITGSALFKRNSVWRRHLSVTITWTITSSSPTAVQGGCKVFPIWK